jgi:hypothetical protein
VSIALVVAALPPVDVKRLETHVRMLSQSLYPRSFDWAAARRVKAAMLGASDLPVHSINTFAAMPGVDFSDHASYWHEGYPALMITDTAFFRNPNYHGAGDTAERLDYARMAKVVQGVFAVAQGR